MSIDVLRKLRSEFPLYAEKALEIRGKSGKGPLILNSAQKYLDERLSQQIEDVGRVRALVLKGRQQGISTYTQGRFYWRVTGGWGRQAFILTHEEAATKNLFAMTRRYHDSCPEALRPRAQRASTNELYFDRLDSGYAVGTARTKGTGRSGTIQYFHGSEVAFWPNQAEHSAGVMQAIPSGDEGVGTEAILESTANGVGELFHRYWQAAERGVGEYQPVFIPWFWQQEYRSPVPPGFELTDEEGEYMDAHGLDLQQMAWRRIKIEQDFEGEVWLFRQEYPAFPAEAFQVPARHPLLDPEKVMAARKAAAVPQGPKILGVDVARQGKDRSAVALRQGRKVHFAMAKQDPDLMSTAGWVARLYGLHRPDAVFIDATGGYGAAVVDRLRELNVPCTEVQYGGRAREHDKYRDKRSEIWGEMADWMRRGAVAIPDQDDLHTDLVGPQHGHDSSGRMWLERKEDMAKRGISSPDVGDALANTFAEPVQQRAQVNSITQTPPKPATSAGY